MSASRAALIVASYEYQDPGLRSLQAPGPDAEALGRVLSDPAIGDFDVRTLLNQTEHSIREAVEEFFIDRSPDDLLLLHFSCHGVKDESGELYFATTNTRLRLLGATGVAAEFVNRCMNRSRSRRVVLLLDCCYAGAFERGMTARAARGVDIEERFGGRGRAVITASSAMEYAFEGDVLADSHERSPSVFTSAIVEGLETGEADKDYDGYVGLDELYEYVYERVRDATPHQTPGKWTFGVQGELYIARRSRPVTTPAALPPELQQAIDHPLPGVRLAAIQELKGLLRQRHLGMTLAAKVALQRLSQDDSRSVSAAAASALSADIGSVGSSAQLVVQASDADADHQAVDSKREPAGARPLEDADVHTVLGKPRSSVPSQAESLASPPDESQSAVNHSIASDSTAALSPDSDPQLTTDPKLTATVSGPERLADVASQLTAALMHRDPLFAIAAAAAIAGAAMLVVAMPLPWQSLCPLGRLCTNLGSNDLYALIVAALAGVGGIRMLVSRTTTVPGPGILLGIAATSPTGLLDAVHILSQYSGVGPDVWLAAHIVLVTASSLAGLWLVLAPSAGIRLRAPDHSVMWLVVLLGVCVAVQIIRFTIFHLLHQLNGPIWSGFAPFDLPSLFAGCWAVAAAVVMPVCVTLVTPRRFGVALLRGWIGASAALYILFAIDWVYGDRIWPTVFGATLLVLLIAAVPFGRIVAPSD